MQSIYMPTFQRIQQQPTHETTYTINTKFMLTYQAKLTVN